MIRLLSRHLLIARFFPKRKHPAGKEHGVQAALLRHCSDSLKANGVKLREEENTEHTEITKQTEADSQFSGLFPCVP